MKNLDTRSFKSFFATYYDRCFCFAKSYVHDEWVAEDIVSEALIKIWEIVRLETIDNPRPLLFTIIKNKSLDYLKHETVKQQVLSTYAESQKRELDIRIATLEACNPDRIFESDIQQIIQNTLSELPEQTRRIFEMNRFQQVSKDEIAQIHGITIKGVDYHLSKALQRFRKNLQDYFPLVIFFVF